MRSGALRPSGGRPQLRCQAWLQKQRLSEHKPGVLAGSWRLPSRFEPNQELEETRRSCCGGWGPGRYGLLCQSLSYGLCLRRKGQKVRTWGTSILILARRARFGNKFSVHRHSPAFSSLSPPGSAPSLATPFRGVYPAQSHFIMVLT